MNTASETAWLAERDGEWYTPVHSRWTIQQAIDPIIWRDNWTKDANKALRFSRREDVEAWARSEEYQDVFATEHKWIPGLGPPTMTDNSEWVKVPRVPTEEMLAAATSALDEWRRAMDPDEKMLRHAVKPWGARGAVRGFTEATVSEKHALRWAAMIATAPQAPDEGREAMRPIEARIAELEAALSASNARVARMEGALLQIVHWFEDYEKQHRGKGTSEGDAKADVNRDRAAFARAALEEPKT